MVRNREIEPEITELEEIEDSRDRAQDEKLKNDEKEAESGYSEAKLAKAIEQFAVGNLDIDDLKKNKSFQGLPAQYKAVIGLKVISRQLNVLAVEYTHLRESNVHQAQMLLDEIKKTRAMQKILLTKLFGKLDAEFPNKEKLERELENLLE